METVKVLQVAGFKNSGKTTVLSRLLGLAKQNGKTVSVIKHHGHGGALETPSSETDSMRFFKKGADSSLAYGGGVLQLHMRKEAADLQELIQFSLQSRPDLVLVEGFKEAGYEKIVLVREKEDWEQLQKLDNIKLVIAADKVQLTGVETIEQNRPDLLEAWFSHWMEGGHYESV